MKEFIQNMVYALFIHTPAEDDSFSRYIVEHPLTKADLVHDFFKYDLAPVLFEMYFLYLFIHAGYFMYRYGLFLYELDTSKLNLSLWGFLWYCVIPFLIWMVSTIFSKGRIWHKKWLRLYLILANIIIYVACGLSCKTYYPILNIVFSVFHLTETNTVGSLLNLSRLLIFIVAAVLAVFLTIRTYVITRTPSISEKITEYRFTKKMEYDIPQWKFIPLYIVLFIPCLIAFPLWFLIHLIDLRKEGSIYQHIRAKKTEGLEIGDNSYDYVAVRRMDNGKVQRYSAVDRMMHTAIFGATGTGKTSTAALPQIYHDMLVKRRRTDYQKKMAYRAVNHGMFRLKYLLDDEAFIINAFEPVITHPDNLTPQDQKNIEFYNHLKYDIESAGITLEVPDPETADKVYTIARNLGFKKITRRIDPKPEPDGRKKEGYTGINPLAMPKGLSEKDQDTYITQAALVVSDILGDIFAGSGSSDPYFQNLNNTMTLHITKVIMLGFEVLYGRQPNMFDLQKLLMKWDDLANYKEIIKDLRGKQLNQDLEKYPESIRKVAAATTTNREVIARDWSSTYYYLEQQMLGSRERAEKLYDQAGGLRNMIDLFLSHSLFNDLYTCPNCFDFDRALADGEIVILNYNQESADIPSRALGLYFTLSFQNAVLRRPGSEKTRISNFTYIDEFSVLVHPKLEKFFSQFRKFRCAVTVMMQSPAQFNKNPSTEFMKAIVHQCGTLMFFGRGDVDMLEYIEKLAGTVLDFEVQSTVSENSITTENPSKTFSTRKTRRDKQRITSTYARHLPFQELIMFTVEAGSASYAFHGYTDFLRDSTKKEIPAVKIDWSRLYTGPENMDPPAENNTAEYRIRSYQTTNTVHKANTIENSFSFSAHGIQSVPKPEPARVLFSAGKNTNLSAQEENVTVNQTPEKSYISESNEEVMDEDVLGLDLDAFAKEAESITPVPYKEVVNNPSPSEIKQQPKIQKAEEDTHYHSNFQSFLGGGSKNNG